MKFFIHLIYIFFFSQFSFSQNIFDLNHSDQYANHLILSEDFENAVTEYERLVNIAPDSLTYKFKLLNAYKLSGLIEKGLNKTKILFGADYLSYPSNIIKIYIELNIINENYDFAETILFHEIKLDDTAKEELYLALNLLCEEYHKIETFITRNDSISIRYNELVKIYSEAENIDYKNPVFAAILSILIPGAGKAYSKDIYNGTLVFSIISLYSLQAYRAFKIDGYTSPYGWGFGVLAGVFYISNVYGSYSSAKRENDHLKYQIKKDVLQTLINSN